MFKLRDCPRLRVRAWAVRLAVPAVCVALAACTQVRVVQGGKTTVSYRLGVLRLEPDPGASLLLVETAGFGMVPVAYGTSLGWARQLVVSSKEPDQCRLIVIIRSAEEAAAIREQLRKGGGSLEHVCEVNTHQGG
ncbi:hypothetical protein [Dyella sp. SG609]|uniref:hypothetical protein n=1 Tax=unclassified Dyella TaxID=2634549 RepID=UPI001447BFD8|nr:hypothetical protein [Dyella sp. SG609]NKJ22341.1 hypothetical protein [Dyella sp. SG609]